MINQRACDYALPDEAEERPRSTERGQKFDLYAIYDDPPEHISRSNSLSKSVSHTRGLFPRALQRLKKLFGR